MPTFVSPRGKGYAPLEMLVCPSCQQLKSDYVKMGMSNDYILKGCPDCGSILEMKDVRYDYGGTD